ncbi:syntaxin-18 [Musca vetustissima]|uniref:syntaxin-18 n=1 Tax=Musca vetustissima TaxID=27455 RepID=UPI002AB6B809|nr:syntaxin-18 [Musca vetustissima]
MDITHLFKAGVMTVKLQRKGELEAHKRILPQKATTNVNGQRDEFSKQAKDVCNKITTLRNVLIENRSAYMRIGQHLKSAVQMTDEQRDLIDRESEKFVTFYTQYLGQMRNDWKKAKRKPQQKEHMEAVLDLLTAYLKSVQQIYLEQKKYRVQHELETYRLLKLASDKKKIPVRPAGEQRSRKTSTVSSTSSKDLQWDTTTTTGRTEQISDTDVVSGGGDGWDLDEDDITVPTSSSSGNKSHDNSNLSNSSFSADTKAQVALDEDIQKSEQNVEDAAKSLSPEDIQMFEEENLQLYHELQGLSEEVEAIEKNVVDIATLQDIFTEKVTLQQHNIERIINAVIGSTENVKDANEQIKQAIQRNAGLRVWSLFFLLVMSLSLLFLDWYYD